MKQGQKLGMSPETVLQLNTDFAFVPKKRNFAGNID
jgi:hypothetical protein